jgi:hypothetical protein
VNESQERRPTQVTIAAGAIIVGALLLFFSGFDSMDNLHTVDFRERVASALSAGGASGLGLTVDQVIGWARVATLVSGGAAAAAAVLGWFALQRHRGARICLTLIAVVLIICAPLGGGALAAFVAVAIAMLWSGQARDWFAGRPVRQREQVTEGPRRSPPEGATAWSDDPGPTSQGPPAPDPAAPSSPAPTRGFGEAPTSAPVFGQPGPAPQQPSYPGPEPPSPSYPGWQTWQSAPAAVDRRPGGVVAACVLTWVFAGASAVVFAFVGVWLAVAPGPLVSRLASMQDFQDAGLPESMIQPVLWVAVALYVGWAVAACVVAFFAWRRHNWARILLVVSAVGAFLLGVFAFPFSIAHIIACGVTAGLLLGGASNRWYARRQPPPGQQGPRQPMDGPPPRAW